MEDEYKDGIIPWYWNIEHFSRYIKEQEAERRGPSFPRKKRLRHSAAEMALPPEIASALHRRGSHPSEWEPIRDRESLRGLRAGERLLLYRRTRKGWEPVSGELTHGARPGESLIALRRRRIQLQPPRLEDGFTFAEGLRWSPHLGPYQAPPPPKPVVSVPLTPHIKIREPDEGQRILLDDDHHTFRHLVPYQFQPGDTLESVTQSLLGYPDPKAVYDRNMRNVSRVWEGDRVRIDGGRVVKLVGHAYDAPEIELVWSGPTQGRRMLVGNPLRGDREWSFKLPVKAGDYEVTARVAGLQSQVRFTMVPGKTSYWLCLAHAHADTGAAAHLPYRATNSLGWQVRYQRLDAKGRATLSRLPPGEVEIEYGDPEADNRELDALKAELKEALDGMVHEVQERAHDAEGEATGVGSGELEPEPAMRQFPQGIPGGDYQGARARLMQDAQIRQMLADLPERDFDMVQALLTGEAIDATDALAKSESFRQASGLISKIDEVLKRRRLYYKTRSEVNRHHETVVEGAETSATMRAGTNDTQTTTLTSEQNYSQATGSIELCTPENPFGLDEMELAAVRYYYWQEIPRLSTENFTGPMMMHLKEVMPQERDAWLKSHERPQMRSISNEEYQASIEAARAVERQKKEAVWRDSFHYRAAFSLQDAEMLAAADAAFAPIAARIGQGLSKLYWGVRGEQAVTHAALRAEFRTALEADFKLYTGGVPSLSVVATNKLDDLATAFPKISNTKGPMQLEFRNAVQLDEFNRLNQVDLAVGKLKPGEASAAVEIQNAFGGQLRRANVADSDVDFVFADGPNQGKTVDFMFTVNTQKQQVYMNKFFNNNFDKNVQQLNSHVQKADIVPLDFRSLEVQNQARLMEVINNMPVEQSSKIVIMK